VLFCATYGVRPEYSPCCWQQADVRQKVSERNGAPDGSGRLPAFPEIYESGSRTAGQIEKPSVELPDTCSARKAKRSYAEEI